MRPRSVETVVIGAGHAGLITSRLLTQRGREHVVLDRRVTLGGGWQDRWDGFRLVSPNWTLSVPGLDYDGAQPDGFVARDEIVAHFRRYAAMIEAPVELGVDVHALRPIAAGAARFEIDTSGGPIRAATVIVAAGPFGRPNVPAFGASLAPSIHQIHAHGYRNPGALPAGGVLLVGSGQTGVQLAEELRAAGRDVTLVVGTCGRVPRRYRDRDIFWWLRRLAVDGPAHGLRLPTASELPSPAARFACNPQLSGHDGGHDVHLRAFPAAGIRLTGRLLGFDGTVARFANDLEASLRFGDAFFDARLRGPIDTFVERAGLDLPMTEPIQVAGAVEEVGSLDLAREGIGTVIWTSGYRPAYGWVEAPVLDELGLPIQRDGWTEVAGLGFIGTHYQHDMASSNLVGVARDAMALVDRI